MLKRSHIRGTFLFCAISVIPLCSAMQDQQSSSIRREQIERLCGMGGGLSGGVAGTLLFDYTRLMVQKSIIEGIPGAVSAGALCAFLAVGTAFLATGMYRYIARMHEIL